MTIERRAGEGQQNNISILSTATVCSVLWPNRIFRVVWALGAALFVVLVLALVVANDVQASSSHVETWRNEGGCRKYEENDPSTWVCSKITGPKSIFYLNIHKAVTYRYSFKAKRTLRGLTLCFGGAFAEARHLCLWRHHYRVFRKGRRVTKKLSGTLKFAKKHRLYGSLVIERVVVESPALRVKVKGVVAPKLPG